MERGGGVGEKNGQDVARCARIDDERSSEWRAGMVEHERQKRLSEAVLLVGVFADGWVTDSYEESRRRSQKGEKTWCMYTRGLLGELGLERVWQDQDGLSVTRDKWRSTVTKAVQALEQRMWLKQVLSKPKLRTYCKFKKRLEYEDYLDCGTRGVRRSMTMLRSGSNDLRVERGRYEGLAFEERICRFCDSGEVENEEHFLCSCSAWSGLRNETLCTGLRSGEVSDLEWMMVAGNSLHHGGDWKNKVMCSVWC